MKTKEQTQNEKKHKEILEYVAGSGGQTFELSCAQDNIWDIFRKSDLDDELKLQLADELKRHVQNMKKILARIKESWSPKGLQSEENA